MFTMVKSLENEFIHRRQKFKFKYRIYSTIRRSFLLQIYLPELGDHLINAFYLPDYATRQPNVTLAESSLLNKMTNKAIGHVKRIGWRVWESYRPYIFHLLQPHNSRDATVYREPPVLRWFYRSSVHQSPSDTLWFNNDFSGSRFIIAYFTVRHFLEQFPALR